MVVRPVKICDLEPPGQEQAAKESRAGGADLLRRTGRMLLWAGPKKSSAVDRFCETVRQRRKNEYT
jgi:hypothetical protein